MNFSQSNKISPNLITLVRSRVTIWPNDFCNIWSFTTVKMFLIAMKGWPDRFKILSNTK